MQIASRAVFWIRDVLRRHRRKEATVAFQRLPEFGVSEEANDLVNYFSYRNVLSEVSSRKEAAVVPSS